MRGRIDFDYDATHDIVIATPHWSIESEADCKLWLEQYRIGLAKHAKRRADIVMVLDDFTISPAIAALWGQYRAALIHEHVRYSVRVHASRRVMIATHTSSVLHRTPTADEADSVREAIEKILKRRASEA